MAPFLPGVVHNGHVEHIDDEKDKGIDLDWKEHFFGCDGQCKQCSSTMGEAVE